MKKGILKRLSCFVLTIVLILCVAPITAMADVGDYEYNEVESNNNENSANLLYHDYTVYGSLSTYYDMDFFIITVRYASEITFLLQSSKYYTLLGLKDSSGNYIEATEAYYDDGYYYNIISGTIQPGTYYFVILGSSEYSAVGSYLFYFDCPGASKVTHTHSYTSNVIQPTCTEDGYTVYTCSTCGYSYKGSYIYASGHTEGEEVIENIVNSTCVSEGSYDVVTYCEDCGEEISRVEEILMVEGHTPTDEVIENYVASTCAMLGSYDTVVYCADCDEEISRETVLIEKLPHTEVVVGAKEATCIETGYTGDTVCSICDTVISEGMETNTVGHTAGKATEEDRIKPTCIATGWYVSVVCCSVCDVEMSRETVTIPVSLAAHVYGDEGVCDKCGAKFMAGDSNGDGKVNTRDAALVMQHANGWAVEINIDTADVNVDGKVNTRDYALLMQFANGWDVELK